MSLVNTLMSGSYNSYDLYESVMPREYELYGTSYTENFLESYLVDQICESAMSELMDAMEASLVADVCGEVRVIKEGADPMILMEGVIANIKNAIVNFFKRVGAFFKNLFTGLKKKSQEAKKSAEAEQLKDEMDDFNEKIKIADESLSKLFKKMEVSDVFVDTYEYDDHWEDTYNKIATEMSTRVTSAINSYTEIISTIADEFTKDGIDKSALKSSFIDKVDRINDGVRSTKINGTELSHEEIEMGDVKYIEYVLHKRAKYPTKLTCDEATKMCFALAGTNEFNKQYYDLAIGGSDCKLYKNTVKTINDLYNQVCKMKDDLLKSIEQCEKDITSKGLAIDDVQGILNKISTNTMQYVSKIMSISQILPRILNEISMTLCKTFKAARNVIIVKHDIGGVIMRDRDLSADDRKSREEMLQKTKPKDNSQPSEESASLFEQAYSFGLI